MGTQVYRLPSRQRRSFLWWGIGLSLLPAVFIVARWKAAGLWGAGPFGPVVAFIDLCYLNMASGRTLVGPDGIRTRRVLWRRSWAWAEIASINVSTEASRYRPTTRRIAVRKTNGRAKALYAPVDWDWPLSDDAFDSTADAIIRAWTAQQPHERGSARP